MIYLATLILIQFREHGHQFASILVEFIDDRGNLVRWRLNGISTFIHKTWTGLFLPFAT